MKKYEFLEHPSDIKIRAFGSDLPEMFVNAALGMMAFLYGDASSIPSSKKSHKIQIESSNLESSLVDWLSEILWLSDTKHCVCTNIQIIEFGDNKIIADVFFVEATANDDIKAVTYHDLKVEKVGNKWISEVVFDI